MADERGCPYGHHDSRCKALAEAEAVIKKLKDMAEYWHTSGKKDELTTFEDSRNRCAKVVLDTIREYERGRS